MKTFLMALIFASSAMASTRTVDSVDLKRYMGNWFEIASIPQSFTKDCVCVRARYKLKKNGKVEVYNSCNRKSPDGKFSDVTGSAKVEDQKTKAKLKVTFFWPFYADYWIVGLADDYRYAIVSNEDGSTAWIISRTPEMSAADLQTAKEIIQKNGIEFEKLKFTEQTGCSYPEDNK